MAELIIEKHKWQPDFKDETWIIGKHIDEEFKITLKQGEDIEIEFTWDYGCGSRVSEIMKVPVQVLKDLISELGM